MKRSEAKRKRSEAARPEQEQTGADRMPAGDLRFAAVKPGAPTWTGSICGVCDEPQFESPGGDTCKNGHGGAIGNGHGGAIGLSLEEEHRKAIDAAAEREDAILGGVTLTVAYPEHTFYPIKYNGFAVGGLAMTVHVPPGGNVQAAHDAAWQQLEAMANKQFQAALLSYERRLRQSAKFIEGKRQK